MAWIDSGKIKTWYICSLWIEASLCRNSIIVVFNVLSSVSSCSRGIAKVRLFSLANFTVNQQMNEFVDEWTRWTVDDSTALVISLICSMLSSTKSMIYNQSSRTPKLLIAGKELADKGAKPKIQSNVRSQRSSHVRARSLTHGAAVGWYPFLVGSKRSWKMMEK